MDPIATDLLSERTDPNTTPITPTPVKVTDDGGQKSLSEAEAEQSLEPSANKFTNTGKTLPLSETNQVESRKAKEAEGIRLQTNSSEEADNNKVNSEQIKNHLKGSKKKKKKIKKSSDGASETAPESRVPSELYEAIKVLEEICSTTNLVVHPNMIAALGPLTIVRLPAGTMTM